MTTLVQTTHDCGFRSKPTTPGMAAYALRRHSCEKWRHRAEMTARGQRRHASIDRTPKPCLHKIAEHQHGTYACYVLDRCKCLPCAAANSNYEQHRLKQRAYGRQSYIDAGPAVAHARELMAAGVGLKQITKLSGISGGSLWKLLYGKRDADGVPRPSVRCTRATAERLLAVRADFPVLAGGALVDPTGTHRRVQALVAIGWSQQRIAERIGMSRGNFGHTMKCAQITARTARQLAEVYDQTWNTPPPEAEHRDRISASRSRNYAKARGWLPPQTWDDDTIDDPAAQPEGAGFRPVKNKKKLPPIEDIEFLLETGESIAAIASRFGASEGGITQALRRSTAA